MRWIAPLLAMLLTGSALAQNVLVPTRPAGDNTNAAASTAFTQNAASNPIPPLTIAPTANSLTQGLIVNQSPAGTQASSYNANSITVTSNAALTGASSFLYGLNMGCSLQSTTVQGGVNCLQVSVGLNSPTNASNANHNYVGAAFIGQANSADGGTNTGAGAQGAVFGSNFVGNAVNGATNLLEVTGGEVDVMLQTGSSSKIKAGWSIVSTSLDKVHGAALDSLLALGAQSGSNGINNVIQFTTQNGIYPAATGGTLIGSDTGTVALGVDFNSVTCSTGCFRSPGFLVDGSGNLTANNVTTAWSAFTPSPSCGTASITVNSSRSKTIGKTTFIALQMTVSTLGTCTNLISISLPNTTNSAVALNGNDAPSGITVTCAGGTGISSVNCAKSGLANFAGSDVIIVAGSYENQ